MASETVNSTIVFGDVVDTNTIATRKRANVDLTPYKAALGKLFEKGFNSDTKLSNGSLPVTLNGNSASTIKRHFEDALTEVQNETHDQRAIVIRTRNANLDKKGEKINITLKLNADAPAPETPAPATPETPAPATPETPARVAQKVGK